MLVPASAPSPDGVSCPEDSAVQAESPRQQGRFSRGVLVYRGGAERKGTDTDWPSDLAPGTIGYVLSFSSVSVFTGRVLFASFSRQGGQGIH